MSPYLISVDFIHDDPETLPDSVKAFLEGVYIERFEIVHFGGWEGHDE